MNKLSIYNCSIDVGALERLSHLKLQSLELTFQTCTNAVLESIPESVVDLSLSDSKFPEGIQKIVHLKNLRGLNFHASELSAANARFISQLSSLEDLTLPPSESLNSWLQGISSLKNLKYLSIREQIVNEQTADLLSNFSALEEIEFPHSMPRDFYKCLSTFHRLKVLDLSFRKIDDAVDINWNALRNLRRLVLTGTEIGDKTICELEHCPLEELEVGSTKISPRCFAALGKLDSLIALTLSNNKLRDARFEDLKNLQNLQLLRMVSCHITDVSDFPALKQLKHLRLSFNPLSNGSEAILNFCNLPSLQLLTVNPISLSPASMKSFHNCLPHTALSLKEFSRNERNKQAR